MHSFGPASFTPTHAGLFFTPASRRRAPATQPAMPHVVTDVQPESDSPSYGVVEVTNSNWAPRKLKSAPPSATTGMGWDVSRLVALTFNASERAVEKSRWMLVQDSGEVLMLTNINGEDRPADPAGFPSCVMAGLTQEEAREIRDAENLKRYEFSRVPRSWFVVVRKTDATEYAKEDNEAAA